VHPRRQNGAVQVLGLVFAGSSTEQRPAMAAFLRDVLSMTPVAVDGVEADLFELPDGSRFAVASPGGMGETSRSVGFLVDDLTSAAAILQESGHPVGPVSENARERYVHFRGPDRHLYELIERKPTAGPGA
jgi:catechol 2,3-dioxygenase-like lactoylglutathione lyase family enzyme